MRVLERFYKPVFGKQPAAPDTRIRETMDHPADPLASNHHETGNIVRSTFELLSFAYRSRDSSRTKR